MGEAELALKRSTTETSTMGEKLRYARETKGLSQQEVARALCLSVSVIDALEKETHEKLPAPVFVKGYLKNYADLLAVPFLLENYAETPPPLILPARGSSQRFFWVSWIVHGLLKLLNYVVLIGLLCLVFVWWHERHHAAEKALTLSNLSIQKPPFPNAQLEPVPPDVKPWLDDLQGNTQ